MMLERRSHDAIEEEFIRAIGMDGELTYQANCLGHGDRPIVRDTAPNDRLCALLFLLPVTQIGVVAAPDVGVLFSDFNVGLAMRFTIASRDGTDFP